MMRRCFSIISLLAVLIVCTTSTQPSRFERSEPVATIEDHYEDKSIGQVKAIRCWSFMPNRDLHIAEQKPVSLKKMGFLVTLDDGHCVQENEQERDAARQNQKGEDDQ